MVLADAKSLRSKVSTLDRVKLDEYFESVRGVEARIDATMKPQKRWINEGKARVALNQLIRQHLAQCFP